MATTVHCIKCWPTLFGRLSDGTKTFEVRKNDRGYQCGDEVHIEEWDPGIDVRPPSYTGRALDFRIGFVFHGGFGCDMGDYVVLSLLPMEKQL